MTTTNEYGVHPASHRDDCRCSACRAAGYVPMTNRPTLEARIDAARSALVELAREYSALPDPEVWRELCRAKATVDALTRCAGGR